MKYRTIIRALAASVALSSGIAPVAGFAATTSPASGPKIRIVTTAGTILATLDPKHAPKTTANFLKYVDAKFFNGGTFFRAIPNFVIQGGNKTKETTHDLPPIALEDPKATHLLNTDGALAMARTSDPDSATSEFFIDDGAQAALDAAPGSPGYAVFGHVTSGMDVVRKIARLPAESEMLTTPVTIVRIDRVK